MRALGLDIEVRGSGDCDTLQALHEKQKIVKHKSKLIKATLNLDLVYNICVHMCD